MDMITNRIKATVDYAPHTAERESLFDFQEWTIVVNFRCSFQCKYPILLFTVEPIGSIWLRTLGLQKSYQLMHLKNQDCVLKLYS